MRFFAFSLERKDGILLLVSILIIKKEIDAYYYFRGRHTESNKTYSSVVKSTLIFLRGSELIFLGIVCQCTYRKGRNLFFKRMSVTIWYYEFFIVDARRMNLKTRRHVIALNKINLNSIRKLEEYLL